MIRRFSKPNPLTRGHDELTAAELDLIAGGGQAASPPAAPPKAPHPPVAIIAILIGM